MTKVSISAEIKTFLEQNQSLKSLPKSEILSIIAQKWAISGEEASILFKNSAFEKGYSKNIDVIPDWTTQKSTKEYQNTAIAVLQDIVNTAKAKVDTQDKTEGKLSQAINYFKETFSTENKKSNFEAAVEDTFSDIKQLEKLADKTEEFKAQFKKLRGVDFSSANIDSCDEKAKDMNTVQSIKDTVDSLKTYLDISTVNDVSNAGFQDANKAILKTFNVLGIKNKNQVNDILKNIEAANKDNPEIKKYGGDFRISKNKKGEYQIYRTDKSGFPSKATMEELQIIAKEMQVRLNKAYCGAIGVEASQNASNSDLEKLANEKYNKVKTEYQQAFKKAYGEKNVNTLADNYIQSQRQNTAYVETAYNYFSLATMVFGSGALLKGASLLTKGSMPLKTLTTVTSLASKATPIVATAQLAQPVQLFENLTAKEPDWTQYKINAKEGALWLALGMVSGGIGDKARLLLKQRGLANAVKNSGKSLDEIMSMYKSGTKVPDNIAKALYKVETAASVQGSGIEFAADVLLTYSANKSLHGDDLSTNDVLMSLNGALIGTAMQKKAVQMNSKQRRAFLQNEISKDSPNFSKAELDLRTNTLMDLSDLAKSKYGNDLYHTTVTNGEGKTVLSEKTEHDTRSNAEIIHQKAERHGQRIVGYMEEAGLGKARETMVFRAKSEQSLYDKIKNAILDVKNPTDLQGAIKTIKDAFGTRTKIEDFDYKKHPNIVKMYEKDPQKAYAMAAERQSQEYVDKVKEVIKLQASDPNANIKAARLTNYKGKDGIPYFSDKQVALLRDHAAQFNIDLNVKDELTKVRPSGYTALQMNFVTKEGFTYEWQLRGSKVNIFADCEHVPYDIRENKDVTGGKKILKRLYAPIEKLVKDMSKDEYKNYNRYLTAHYEHLRKLELGFKSNPPKLEDFGLKAPELKAENLELLHDLTNKLKKGEINENNAVWTYTAKTENRQNLEKGYITDAKTHKPVKVDISKIKVDTNEYHNSGSVSINDEFGNILGSVLFNAQNNHFGQPSIHFEGLLSNVEGLGLGTKLLEELVKISKSNGFEGRLTATASPMKGVNGKLTNIEFYYKKGFVAVSPEKHAMIEECLRQNKEIPLALNLFTEIEYIPKN